MKRVFYSKTFIFQYYHILVVSFTISLTLEVKMYRVFPLIHGFHHITDLDFYKRERKKSFFKILIDDYKFNRTFDDQIGATLPAATYALTRSCDYQTNGLNFAIRRHGDLDGDIYTRNAIYNRIVIEK